MYLYLNEMGVKNMTTFSVLLIILTILLLPALAIVWIILAIKKKTTKQIKLAFFITLGLFIVSIIIGIASICDHVWADATCSAPKTCIKCGQIEGTPTDHSWEAATCTAPETCILCKETRGNSLDHIWKDATCTEAKSCTLCGESLGETLGHTAGDWVIDEESRDIVTATIWRRKYCSVCADITDSDLRSFPLHEDNLFLFTPEEFTERVEKIYKYLDKTVYETELIAFGDNLGCVVMDSDAVAAIMFMSEDGLLTGKDTESREIGAVVVGYYTDDISEVVNVMIGVIIACDNSLEQSDAADVAQQMIVASYLGEPYYHNGIGYVFGDDGDGYKLIVSVLEN